MALRPQDPLPDWVTHVALINGRNVRTGPRDNVGLLNPTDGRDKHLGSSSTTNAKNTSGRELVSMKDVNVRYHERHVSGSFYCEYLANS